MKLIRLLLLILVLTFSTMVYAVDKGVYEGQWKSTTPAITLKIKPTSVSFIINNKTYTSTTPQYLYGQLATFPFLYIRVQEPSTNKKYAFYEYRFYLIMGEEKASTTAKGKLKLRGYYDWAKIQKGGNGLVENQTYPILFERISRKP